MEKIETRELSTGHLAVFDRGERTLYLINADRRPKAEISSRDELKRMAKSGEAFALHRTALVSLYEEFARIAVLV